VDIGNLHGDVEEVLLGMCERDFVANGGVGGSGEEQKQNEGGRKEKDRRARRFAVRYNCGADLPV
jgi:hypothetical protein